MIHRAKLANVEPCLVCNNHMRNNSIGMSGSQTMVQAAIDNCVGEMSSNPISGRCCPVFDSWPGRRPTSILSPPDVSFSYMLSAISLLRSVLMSPIPDPYVSDRAMITWFMPMLPAALVAKCPQTGADVIKIHTTRNISIKGKFGVR